MRVTRKYLIQWTLSPKNKKARQISPAGLLVYFYFIVIMHYSLPHGARYLAFAMSRLGFIFRRGA
jgi:hypothetical protein